MHGTLITINRAAQSGCAATAAARAILTVSTAHEAIPQSQIADTQVDPKEIKQAHRRRIRVAFNHQPRRSLARQDDRSRAVVYRERVLRAVHWHDRRQGYGFSSQ